MFDKRDVNMKINEIFYSIQGEGQYLGRPMVFIRVSGCNLRCNWCDTKYAYDEGIDFSIDEIIKELTKFPSHHACLTGGEPLIQYQSLELIERLIKLGYFIYLETNGSINIENIPRTESLRFSLDIKCPSSGEEHKMNFNNLKLLGSGDQIKFIIADDDDYSYAKKVIKRYLKNIEAEIIFTPCHFGIGNVHHKIDFSTLAEKVLKDGLNVRVLPQLHKILWPDKEHGV